MTGCFGVVLAGGRALRLGGGDKCLRSVGGAPILTRVIATLGPQCAGLVLSANGDPARFAAFGLPVIADDVPGFKGPLAGLLAGLDWIAAHRPEVSLALSAPADAPFLPDDLAHRLEAARRAAGADMACARSGRRTHPVAALWPVAIRADLRRALVKEDLRKVEGFLARHHCVFADWEAEPFDPFFNANTPGDFEEAEAIASREGKKFDKPENT